MGRCDIVYYPQAILVADIISLNTSLLTDLAAHRSEWVGLLLLIGIQPTFKKATDHMVAPHIYIDPLPLLQQNCLVAGFDDRADRECIAKILTWMCKCKFRYTCCDILFITCITNSHSQLIADCLR